MKRFALLLFLISICPLLRAADVSLTWDHSPSSGVVGYKVYVGRSSRTYGTPIVIGYQTTYTVTGLGPGTYYFAVTAFDADGNESDFSNEVSQVISSGTLQILTTACSSNWYGVVCLAVANKNSSAVFKYQKIGSNGWTFVIATPTETKTQHRAVVYFNQGSKDFYNYQWQVTAAGVTVSSTGTFQTK